MPRHVRAVICVTTAAVGLALVLPFSLRVWASAGRQDPAGQPAADTVPSTGLIAGQVVDAAPSKPVGGATVNVTGPPPSAAAIAAGLVPPGGLSAASPSGAPRQVLTGAQGQFVFHSLPRGHYNLRATAPGYVSSGYGQNRPTGPGQTLELITDSTKLGDVHIRVWKTATIRGTVIDEAGEPLIGLQIMAVRRAFSAGRSRLQSTGGTTTDDRGMYRFSNLTPGEYLVVIPTSPTTFPVSVTDAYSQLASSEGSIVNTDLYRDVMASGVSFSGFSTGVPRWHSAASERHVRDGRQCRDSGAHRGRPSARLSECVLSVAGIVLDRGLGRGPRASQGAEFCSRCEEGQRRQPIDCAMVRFVDPRDVAKMPVVKPDPHIQYAARVVKVPACKG